MKILYIIGNGFDICHGINSKYSDYHEWLVKNDNSIYEKLCAIYDTYGYEWWNNFEQSLSKVSFDYINKTSSENAPVYGSDDFNDADNHRASVQVELDMQNLLDSIKLSMESWINGLNKANKEKLRIEGKDHSFFITFNYTKTLEEVYNIPKGQICHIHGCISEGDLKRVFDKSFTGKNGRCNVKSTGMGLYIVKNLCDKLGHNIKIFSKEKEYTKVVIEFGNNDMYKF